MYYEFKLWICSVITDKFNLVGRKEHFLDLILYLPELNC